MRSKTAMLCVAAAALLAAPATTFAQEFGSWMPPHHNFPYWGAYRNWHPGLRPGLHMYDDGYYQPWRGGLQHGWEPYYPRRGNEMDSTFREPCCPEPIPRYSSPDMPLPDFDAPRRY